MARYKYPRFLTAVDWQDFDQIHYPGGPTPQSGIYKCEACGIEAVDEFLRNHMNVEPDPSPDPNSAGEQAPNFIHLRDAQCLGGLGVVPSDKGMYLRISIASINGFSLTRIHRGAKK